MNHAEPTVLKIILRLICAMIIGGVVGFQREYMHRPAGLRTHMLVAIASCAVMITSQMIFFDFQKYGASTDPTRLSAQIISGIGFLGAGTILREGTIVKGLTTAASIWAVACLCIAVGAGYYQIGLIGLLLLITVLTLVEWLQKKVFAKHTRSCSICVRYASSENTPVIIQTLAGYSGVDFHTLKCSVEDNNMLQINVRACFSGYNAKKQLTDLIAALSSYSSCVRINE